MATLESKDSRSTLVEEPTIRPRMGTPHPLPQTPGSPFSASFDPNNATPQTPPDNMFSPMTGIIQNPPLPSAPAALQDAWRTSIAISLNALSSQFATASQALATIPTTERQSPAQLGALAVIEQTQARLQEEMEALREQVEYLRTRSPGKEKGRAQPDESSSVDMDAYDARMTAVEQKVEELAETIRLDQSRLYARLLNSTITTNKTLITAPMMANGKTPQNFPATRGEFEHLTKERYEFLMKSYGIPIKGDTAAKRQALREFIGLSPAKP